MSRVEQFLLGNGHNRAAVHVGLINNMPDAAMRATELQFARLLKEAAGALDVRLRLFSMQSIPRGEQARSRMAGFYDDAAFLQAARSVVRAGLRPRRFKNTMRSIEGPVLLIHGDRDRLVPVAAARIAAAANPKWDTEFLHDVGHTPQLETPDAVIDAVGRWLDRHELGATAANNTTAPAEENR